MTTRFFRSAAVRAVRTIAQTAVALIGTAQVVEAVDWQTVASASLLAGVLSVLTSVGTGLPEAPDGPDIDLTGPWTNDKDAP